MKVCLKKEVSGSHEQCTGPTGKSKFKKKKRQNATLGIKSYIQTSIKLFIHPYYVILLRKKRKKKSLLCSTTIFKSFLAKILVILLKTENTVALQFLNV